MKLDILEKCKECERFVLIIEDTTLGSKAVVKCANKDMCALVDELDESFYGETSMDWRKMD